MHLDTTEERLIVISDLHLGNPYSLASTKLRTFVDYIIDNGYSLCINGDGMDILQGRFEALASQTLDIVAMLQRLGESGARVYYVVGNHDMSLEHVFHTWLGDYLTPFLNVRVGELLVRVEHGHIYDPFYAFNPRVYERLGAAVAPLLRAYPDAYELWSKAASLRIALRARLERGADPRTPEQRAAQMLADRGFDVVVFGHTHRPEQVALEGGAHYVNAGNWLRNSTFVEITPLGAKLARWTANGAIIGA